MLLPTLPATPYEVTADTFVIPTFAAAPDGTTIAAHSLVIRGAEPVILDTGCSLVRDEWVEHAFSVVEPEDVRWVLLTHDDHDHIGNIDVVMERCVNATLVVNYPIVARLVGDVELPIDRMQWVNEGETLTLSDRALHFVRPPMFDSPSTRAVFDSSTGVMWGADSFAAALPGTVFEVADVPDEMLDEHFPLHNQWNTPWLQWVDRARFDAHVADTASLPVTAWASAHGPVFRGDEQIADALARTRALAGAPMPPLPGQDVLELIQAVLGTPAQ
jgi:flavorubredoxin